jgi:hypothetical protein
MWTRSYSAWSHVRMFLIGLPPPISRYLDSDVFVNGDLSMLVSMALRFKKLQWAGFASEDGTHYTKGGTHGPYFGASGLNSGIFLFNATRWRRTGFDEFVRNYKGHMPLGDQDIINAYFRFHTAEVFVLPCVWNYRTDSQCYPNTPHELVGVYHGNRGAFARYDHRLRNGSIQQNNRLNLIARIEGFPIPTPPSPQNTTTSKPCLLVPVRRGARESSAVWRSTILPSVCAAAACALLAALCVWPKMHVGSWLGGLFAEWIISILPASHDTSQLRRSVGRAASRRPGRDVTRTRV